jgi:hypothetical protein
VPSKIRAIIFNEWPIESIRPSARHVGWVRQNPIHVKRSDNDAIIGMMDLSSICCPPSTGGGFRRNGNQHIRVPKRIELRTRHCNNIF